MSSTQSKLLLFQKGSRTHKFNNGWNIWLRDLAQLQYFSIVLETEIWRQFLINQFLIEIADSEEF